MISEKKPEKISLFRFVTIRNTTKEREMSTAFESSKIEDLHPTPFSTNNKDLGNFNVNTVVLPKKISSYNLTVISSTRRCLLSFLIILWNRFLSDNQNVWVSFNRPKSSRVKLEKVWLMTRHQTDKTRNQREVCFGFDDTMCRHYVYF